MTVPDFKCSIFQISHGIGLNLLAFIPTVILGVIGGLLGAVFTFLNLKVECLLCSSFRGTPFLEMSLANYGMQESALFNVWVTTML